MSKTMNHSFAGDPRYCPTSALLRSMHRLLLLCPVLGLPHEFEQHCVRVDRTRVEDGDDDDDRESVYTWKAVGSRIVTIMKVAPTTTVIWDQGTGTSFKAHPCCSLGPGCPVGSVFLGQVVMDRVLPPSTHDDSIQDWRINVLVFDILSFGHDRNFVQNPETASVRYALLRDLEDNYSKGVFTSQSMKVQWAGKLDALKKFKREEGPKLPHIIDCFVRLGKGTPLEGMGMVVADEEPS